MSSVNKEEPPIMTKIKVLLLILLTSTCSISAQTSIASLLPPDKDKGIEYYFTDDIRMGICTLSKHLRDGISGRNADVVMEDVNALYESLRIWTDTPSKKTLHISTKLDPFPEYYDMLAICHLTAANIFLHRNDTAMAQSRFGNVYSIGANKSSFRHSEPSPIQIFMCSLADYLREIHNVSQITNGIYGLESRSYIMSYLIRSRYFLRHLCSLPIEPSKCDIVNELLLHNLCELLNINTSRGFKKATEEAYAKMSETLDTNIDQWIKLQYPIEHFIYFITNNMDYSLNTYAQEQQHNRQLIELSEHGSGTASYYLGNRLCQKLSHSRIEPEEVRRMYKLSSEQGCAIGTMRYATCLVDGFGGKKDYKRAYTLLKPLTGHVEFPKNGAFAYAILLDNGMDKDATILDLMNYYAMAAEGSLEEEERDFARDRCSQLYAEHYQ